MDSRGKKKLDVLVVGVEKSWRRPRDQLLVLLVKRATLERPADTKPMDET